MSHQLGAGGAGGENEKPTRWESLEHWNRQRLFKDSDLASFSIIGQLHFWGEQKMSEESESDPECEE